MNPLPLAAIAATDRVANPDLVARACGRAARRFLPVLALAFIFNFLDRTSVGFAALTMNRDIGLTPETFGLGAGILFASYCLFEVPSNLALYRFGARRWLARIMITWGLAAAATALVTGPISFYLIRLLLGIAEAGFFPGVVFFLSTWFPKQYRTRVLAWFTVAIPFSSIVGGPISGLLLEMDGAFGLAGWQWMFIIEGLPACILALVTLRLLSDDPAGAEWMPAEERQALAALLAAEKSQRPQTRFLQIFRDPRIAILASITFCFTIGSYGITIWLPQILRTHQLSNLTIGFVSAIPYIFATLGMLLWARQADRTGRSIRNLTLACLTAAAGLGFAISTSWLTASLAGLTLALVGATAARTLFYTIPPKFLSGAAAAGGLALVNSIGSLGGFVGPYTVGLLKEITGSFSIGLFALAAFLVIGAGMTASLNLLMPDEK